MPRKETRIYQVVWEIEFEAMDPEHAARLALEVHRDPESIATVFKVFDRGVCNEIDLTQIDEDKESVNP